MKGSADRRDLEALVDYSDQSGELSLITTTSAQQASHASLLVIAFL
jgi:hypothetical protein